MTSEEQTRQFISACASSRHTLNQLMKEPEIILTKMHYELPSFREINNSTEYKASTSTLTVAADTGDAAAYAAISPSKL